MRLSLWILAVAGSLTAYAAAPLATFDAPRAFSVSYPVLAIAVADFDGDGKPDVAAVTAACEFCGGFVSILLNNGHGGYQPERRHPVGSSYLGPDPQGIAAADLNGDGRPDLVVANPGDGTVSILLNTGDGTFGGQKRYTVGSFASSVAIGDFNGDGIPDLAVSGAALFGFGGFAILLGNGNGTFQPAAIHSIGYSGPLAVGDFNRDGKTDLAVLTTNGLSIVLGNGDGTFQSPVSYPAGGPSSTFVVAGDLNGDGKLDLAIANGATILVLLGKGDGTFGAAVPYTVSGTLSLTVADVNGDGIPDIVSGGTGTVNVNNVAAVLLGRGDGSFRPAMTLNVPGAPQSVAVADVDGDGNPDLLFGESQFAVAVLGGNGHGQFQQASAGYPVGSVPNLVAADFNGDGNLDLAITSLSQTEIWLGNGKGGFLPPIPVPGVSGPFTVGDLNGDGKPDLIFVQDQDYGDPGTVKVMLGRGDGTFRPPMTFPAGLEPVSPIVGDFNGDGKMDVMVVNASQYSSPGTVSVLLGNGDGTLRPPLASPAGISPGIAIAGDFNNDGKPDVAVISTYENTVSVLLGNGEAGFQPLPAFAAPPLRTGSIVAGDFNGDGNLDIAIGGEGSVSVYVLPGNGNGTFQTGASLPVPSGVDWIGVGDFDGDGKLDLAVMGDLTSTVSILLGNGDATFGLARNFLVGVSNSAVVGTFHSGGLPDVAVGTTTIVAGSAVVVMANTTMP